MTGKVFSKIPVMTDEQSDTVWMGTCIECMRICGTKSNIRYVDSREGFIAKQCIDCKTVYIVRGI